MNNKLNEIVDDKLWGRGTVDDKGSINAALFGLAALKESWFKPFKKIKIIFGCDEESGSEDMEYYTWIKLIYVSSKIGGVPQWQI